jgi:hypothetical protein
MKPRERRETGEQDLFRSRLDQIIDMNHALVKLATAVSWSFIETKCGEVYSEGPGMPPLPTRLMAGLAILKHTFDLSDEELCARWVENPYFQYFCGEEFFCHALPFDRSSMTGASGWARAGPSLLQRAWRGDEDRSDARGHPGDPRHHRSAQERDSRPMPSSSTGRARAWSGWPERLGSISASPIGASASWH